MSTDNKNFEAGGGTSHVEEIGKSFPINHDAYVEAKEDALSEGKPTWQVIKENIRICVVVVAVQLQNAVRTCITEKERRTFTKYDRL